MDGHRICGVVIATFNDHRTLENSTCGHGARQRGTLFFSTTRATGTATATSQENNRQKNRHKKQDNLFHFLFFFLLWLIQFTEEQRDTPFGLISQRKQLYKVCSCDGSMTDDGCATGHSMCTNPPGKQIIHPTRSLSPE